MYLLLHNFCPFPHIVSFLFHIIYLYIEKNYINNENNLKNTDNLAWAPDSNKKDPTSSKILSAMVIQEGYVSDLACEEYRDDTSLVDTMFTP